MADSVKQNNPLGWLVDPLSDTSETADRAFQFTADRRAWLAPLAIGIALLGISGVGFALDPRQFYFSYLTGWSFLLTTAVGGLFFLFFQHLTRSAWSVTTRRINEALVWAFPLLALLGIPILFGMHDLYHWTHAELYDPNGPEYDPILAGKRSYLNTPFWIVRMVLYFGLWTYITYRLYTLSVKMDVEGASGEGGEKSIPAKLRTVSAWGLPLSAVATAFCSYDVLMSTDPHWFSTIFGVYFFSGGILAAVSTIALISLLLQRAGGMMQDVVTKEHYQDLGKYMFGFVVFWAYIAFSQYMLYWYGGIPEEIVWFQHRLEGPWAWHSAMLLLLHFVVPFFILLPRFTKRSIPVMGVMTVWLIGMHWFDMHWIVRPVMREAASLHWLDFTTWLGLTFVFGGFLMYRLARHSLVPQKDPYLADSLHFENT